VNCLWTRESGQTAVEFGIFGVIFMMLTVGLVDVGRAFFQYNEVSALARYGARWGSVVGGTCALGEAKSTSDWCNRLGAGGTNRFWKVTTPLSGNTPKQGFGIACDAFDPNNASRLSTEYFAMQSYAGTPSIVGAIADKYDSDSSHSNLITGNSTVGLDRSQVYVCISTTNSGIGTQLEPTLGDTITVTVGYNFVAASGLFGKRLTFPLRATSTYKVE
jgi:TadE-like protein